MVKYYFKSAKHEQFKEISNLKKGGWIDITNAKNKDIHMVSELTGLEFEDLNDSLDLFEIPRLEYRNEIVILFIRTPVDEENGMHTAPLTLIVTEEYFITISPVEIPVLQEIVEKGIDSATTQSAKLLILILLKISHLYNENIKKVRSQVVGLEFDNTHEVSSQDILSLTKNEEILNQYLSALTPIRNIIETLLSGRHMSFHTRDNDLLEDLLISIHQSVDVCSVNLKSISSLRDARQIIFTNRLNRTIQLLTVITIVLTIPTIVSSIYGMNIQLPYMNDPIAFPAIMVVTSAISFLVLLIFIVKKWL